MTVENRQQIGELLDGFRDGKISRRDLMVKGSALGVGAYFLNRLTSDVAFAQDATPEAIEAGSTLVAPAGVDQSLAGQKLTVILGDEGSGAPWEKAAVALFQETTGIETTRIPGETSATDRLSKYLLALNGRSSDIDAMMIDVIWPGIMAPHALDLTDTFTDSIANYFAAIVQHGGRYPGRYSVVHGRWSALQARRPHREILPDRTYNLGRARNSCGCNPGRRACRWRSRLLGLHLAGQRL